MDGMTREAFPDSMLRALCYTRAMSPIETLAVALGIACVYLIIRQNIWCWPIGIAMVTLYAWIFYDARLYSDAGLQVIYIGLQIYGWYYWLTGKAASEAQAPIIMLTARWRGTWATIAVAATAALGFVMSTYTDADLAYWDATTTVLSLIAQALLSRKVLENWLVWIAVDVLAIGIYSYKELYLTAGLYAVFLGMASWGLLVWWRDWQDQRAAPASAGA